MDGIKKCPIATALDHIGRKWTINIIRDLFMGRKRFRDFLEANPELSTRILSLRLKNLEKEGFIIKKIVSKSPLRAEYELTRRGKDLNKILYEMAMYSFRNYGDEVLFDNNKQNCDVMGKLAKETLKLK